LVVEEVPVDEEVVELALEAVVVVMDDMAV
jgi:hypothetical protein